MGRRNWGRAAAIVLTISLAWGRAYAAGIVAYDNWWGSFTKYNENTGADTALSMYWNGQVIGSGSTWATGRLLDPNTLLRTAADGAIMMSRGTSKSIAIYRVDRVTGNRTTYTLATGAAWTIADYDFVPHPANSNLAYVVRHDVDGTRHRRQVFQLTLSTGVFTEISTKLTIPAGNYSWGHLITPTWLRIDSSGRFIVLGKPYTGSGVDLFGLYVYTNLNSAPIAVTTMDTFTTVPDLKFDFSSNRLYRATDSGMQYSQQNPSTGAMSQFVALGPARSYTAVGFGNGNVYAASNNRIVRVDPTSGAVTELPATGPVGTGLASPSSGRMSADATTVMHPAQGKFVWSNLLTGASTQIAASCTAQTRVVEETADSVLWLDSNRSLVRTDKTTGTSSVVQAGPFGAINYWGDNRLVYHYGSGGPIYVKDLTTGQVDQLGASGGWGPIKTTAAGDLLLDVRIVSNHTRVIKIDCFGRQTILADHRPANFAPPVPTLVGMIEDFEYLPDQGITYYVVSELFALFAARDTDGMPWVVSGILGTTFGGPLVGDGPAWGVNTSSRLQLYGIRGDYAYIGDDWVDGIFRVHLATGHRDLISAPEDFPFMSLTGLSVITAPEPGTLLLLAGGGLIALAAARKRRRRLPRRGMLLIAAALTLAGPARAKAADYTVVQLESLPGQTRAQAINNAGQVVGYGFDAAGQSRPVQWNGQAVQLLDLLAGGVSGAANAINDHGRIAGMCTTIQGAIGRVYVTVWNGGVPGIVEEYTAATVRAINDSGVIVGSRPSGSLDRAATWTNSTPLLLPTLGGTASRANAITDDGRIAGTARNSMEIDRPVVYVGGALQELGALNAKSGYAADINNNGQIAGGVQFLFGGSQAAIWSAADPTNPAFIGQFTATAINDQGWVVGYNAASEAVLYNGKSLVTLNSLAPDSGWKLQYAADINDSGWIIGYGKNPSKQEAVFLMQPPVPEPATLSLLAGGMLGLGWALRRVRTRSTSVRSCRRHTRP